MDKRSSNQNSTPSVHILGYICSVPEINEKDKKKVAMFDLLSHEAYVNEKGVRVETSTTIKVIAYDGLATIVERYLSENKQVAICGQLVAEKQGKEIIATDILMLGERRKN